MISSCLTNWLSASQAAARHPTTCSPLQTDRVWLAFIYLAAGQRISVPFAIISGVHCAINCEQSRFSCGKLMRRGVPTSKPSSKQTLLHTHTLVRFAQSRNFVAHLQFIRKTYSQQPDSATRCISDKC